MYILRDNILSKEIEWDEAKNVLLQRRRGICFEVIVEALAREEPIWVKEHPRPEKYPGQKLLAVSIGGYVFVAPFEETNEKIIL